MNAPAPKDDLREAREALTETIRSQLVVDEYGNIWGSGDAADAVFANHIAPLLAQRDAAEAERDEAIRMRDYYASRAGDARARNIALDDRARAAEDRAARLETVLINC